MSGDKTARGQMTQTEPPNALVITWRNVRAFVAAAIVVLLLAGTMELRTVQASRERKRNGEVACAAVNDSNVAGYRFLKAQVDAMPGDPDPDSARFLVGLKASDEDIYRQCLEKVRGG